MPHLNDLAIKYRSDKSTSIGNSHAYTLVYDMLFRLGRNSELNILEIGLCIGGPENNGDINRMIDDVPSINMWKEYFPKSHIYGFDISDFSAFEDERFTFVRGDCGVASDLQKVVNLGKQFDVIVDDASHASFHQFMTMSVMWSALKPGGLYIVEDLDWQPAEYEASLPATPKFGPFFHHFAQTGKFPSDMPAMNGFAQIKDEIYFTWIITVEELRQMRKFHRLQHPESASRKSGEARKSNWLNTAIRRLKGEKQKDTPYLAIIQKA